MVNGFCSKNAGERRERAKEVKKTLKKATAVAAPPNDDAASPAIGGKMRSEAGKKVAVSLDGFNMLETCKYFN